MYWAPHRAGPGSSRRPATADRPIRSGSPAARGPGCTPSSCGCGRRSSSWDDERASWCGARGQEGCGSGQPPQYTKVHCPGGLLHATTPIRIVDFRDTRLPEGRIDAVIGNVPFADLKLEHRGQRLSLHDFFFAKSIDALKPGGDLALVTTHFTLDKQNAALREYLASRA